MRSVKSIKGFKNDKRNLTEDSNNLIVFGEGQTSEITARGRRQIPRLRGRPDNRHPMITHSRSVSRASQPLLVPGPGSALRRVDRFAQRDMTSSSATNYFLGTKPWKLRQPPTAKKSSTDEQMKGTSPANDSASPSTNFQMSKSSSQIQSDGRSSRFEGVHVCPVCSKGFDPISMRHIPAADMMRQSMLSYQKRSSVQFRKNLEDGWGGSAKTKCANKPNDVVVSANCGELFHKICLRDWCSLNHKMSPRSQKPTANCPSCRNELKYTVCQDIDVARNYNTEHTTLERELIQTKLVNKELQLLWPDTSGYLGKLQNDIRDAETLHKEIKSKKRHVKSELKKLTAEDFSVVLSKVTDAATLRVMLEKQEKALEFMQQETLQIMRMYLLMVIRKKRSTSSLEDGNANPKRAGTSQCGRIPPQLTPHIQNILNDDHSLQLLSKIIAPMPEEENDAEKRKLLELELLQKYYPTNMNNLIRTNTYTVFSSAAEAKETKSESRMRREEHLKKSSVILSDEEKLFTLLKAVTGTHKIPAETISCNGLILQSKPMSDRSLPMNKPSKLFEIEEITPTNECLKINSSAGLLKQISKVLEEEEGTDEVQVLKVKFDSQLEDAEEEEEEGSPEEEYYSPLRQFPLPPSFKPMNWLSNGDAAPSSLDVHAMSIPSRQLEPAGQVERSDKEKEALKKLLENSAVNLGCETETLSSVGDYVEVEETNFSNKPCEREIIVITEPGVQLENDDKQPTTAINTAQKEAEEDDNASWTTVSGDEDEEAQSIATYVPNPPPPTFVSDSCELVFSAKDRREKMAKTSPQIQMSRDQIQMSRDQAPVQSDFSQTSVPGQQVSIAIMYIVDEGGEDSGSEMGESEVFSKAIPDSTLSARELSHIHVDAEKASKYSLIASQRSSLSSSLDIDLLSKRYQKGSEKKGEQNSCPTPISDALEKYRPPPPNISSWQHGGIRLEHKVTPVTTRKSRHHHNSDNPINYRLQEAIPNANLTYETKMFYENETPDYLGNVTRVPFK